MLLFSSTITSVILQCLFLFHNLTPSIFYFFTSFNLFITDQNTQKEHTWNRIVFFRLHRWQLWHNYLVLTALGYILTVTLTSRYCFELCPLSWKCLLALHNFSFTHLSRLNILYKAINVSFSEQRNEP